MILFLLIRSVLRGVRGGAPMLDRELYGGT